MPPETQQQTEGKPPTQDSTGTIKDQGTTILGSEKPTTETTTTDQPSDKADGKTLLTQKDDASSGAPDKYEDFKAPADWAEKGFELDGEIIKEAVPLFKELGLSQDQAQRLVDFYANTSTKASEASAQAVIEQNERWVAEIKADKDIGPRLGAVKATVSKAIDSLGPELSAGFREAMDFTGVGNHPAFVKAFYKLAQRLTEGSHTAGNGPSPHGQKAPGSAPRSAAAALYPDLPSAG